MSRQNIVLLCSLIRQESLLSYAGTSLRARADNGSFRTTPKELGVYLVESGEIEIHESAWPYLDYERVALEYEANNAGAYTSLGYVVKTGDSPE